jgi:hypothetical protein
MNPVYVVLMRRWGNKEGHTYILGAYESRRIAWSKGELEATDRGGKYEFEIFKCVGSATECVADTCGDQTHHIQEILDRAKRLTS